MASVDKIIDLYGIRDIVKSWQKHCIQYFCPPSPVVVPNSDFSEFCTAIEKRSYPMFFDSDGFNRPLVKEPPYSHFKKYGKYNPISLDFCEFARPLKDNIDVYLEPKFNFITKVVITHLAFKDNDVEIISQQDAVNVLYLLSKVSLIKFNNQLTIVPINKLYRLLKSILNKIIYDRFSDNPLIDVRSICRWYFNVMLPSHGYHANAILLYIAAIDHDKLPNSCYYFSAVQNSKILLSQLPNLYLFLYSMCDLNRLSYSGRFISEIFVSFLTICLQTTNPPVIMESGFISDMIDHLVHFTMARPRVCFYTYAESGCSISYEKWDYSEFQLGLDHRISVDEDFCNVLSKIVANMEQALALFQARSSNIYVEMRQRFVGFISICYNLYRFSFNYIKYQDCIVNILGILFSSPLADSVISAVRNFFERSEPQYGSSDFVLKSVALAAFVLMVRKIPSEKSIDMWINRLDRIPRAFDGVGKMWSKFDYISDTLWPWIEETVLQRKGKFPKKEILNEVSDWVNELERLTTLASREDIRMYPADVSKAGRMYSEGIRLTKMCSQLRLTRENSEIVSKLLPTAKMLTEEALKSGAMKNRLRQAPVITWFTGGSGVGKTSMTYPFIIDMMRSFGEVPKDYCSNIYARMAETVFWDAFTNQEYIIIDDAFQMKDSQLKPNPELFELIRLGNTFSYQLHMADISEKNNTFASPKFVMLTSNLDKIQAESLNCPEAVARRIDFAYRVSIKPEFQYVYVVNNQMKYRLDVEKASRNCKFPINFDVYEFERFDPVTDMVIERGLSYRQVVEQGQALMRKNFESHDTSMDFLDEYRQHDAASLPVSQTLLDEPISEIIPPPFEFNDFSCPPPQIAQGGVVSMQRPISLNEAYSNDYYLANIKNFSLKHFYSLKYKFSSSPLSKYFYTRSPKESLYRESLYLCQVMKARIVKEKELFTYYVDQFLGTHWKYLKVAASIVAIGFATYITFQSSKIAYEAIVTPQYVKDEKKLAAIVTRANECILKGCSSCTKCQHAYDDDLCIKWYSKCHCYASAMESTDNYLQLYACAAHNHSPKTIERVTKLNPDTLILILKQLLNCDCSRCHVCNDDILTQKFSNIAKVNRCGCNCVNARFDQGFSLVVMLGLIKHLGDFNRGIIKNKYLLRMYQTMSTDIAYFESSDEARDLFDMVDQTDARRENVRVSKRLTPKYQTDDKIEQVRKLRMRTRYQTSEEIATIAEAVKPLEQRCAPEGDLNSDTIVDYVAYPNMAYMIGNRKSDSVERSIGHILFVKGTIALMPYHYWVALQEGGFDSVTLYTYSKNSASVPLSALKRTHRFENKDVFLVEFPIIINSRKDILKHIISKSDYSKVAGCPGKLARLEYKAHQTRQAPYHLHTLCVSERDVDNIVVLPETGTTIISREYYSYEAPTRAGDCGAPLIVMHSNIQGKIIGIHNSGSPMLNHGNAAAINREMIVEALGNFSSLAQHAYESSECHAPLDVLQESGNFLVHRIDPTVNICSANKSAIAKSPVYGALIDSPNKPGKLRPFVVNGTTIDPMVLQRKKYGVPRPLLDQNLCDSVVEGLKPVYYRSNHAVPDHHRMPLTEEEAVLGIVGDPYMNAINRSTAPGYPYTFQKDGCPGKTKWFGNDDEYDLTNVACQALFQDVRNLRQNILDGVRPEVVWIDTLKDQKILKAKADIGKTRLFSAAPLHYVIALREIALPFIAHCSRERVHNTVAVGINPASPEWSELARHLQGCGSAVIAGDYSNFDGTLPAQLVVGAVYIMVDWYRLHWDFIISNKRNVINGRELSWLEFRDYCTKLYFECVQHLHVFMSVNGAVFYNVRNGIPSGCPVTALINSIVNHLCLAYAWLKIFENTERASVSLFLENTRTVFYGDDFIMNIRRSFLEEYNQLSISKCLKEFLDMDMTDEAKTGEMVHHRALTDVSFLKRKFRWEEAIGEWTAPLELDVILDSVNWVRLGNEAPISIVMSTIEAAMRELALHDPQTDSTWRDKISDLGVEVSSALMNRTFKVESRYLTLCMVKNSLWKCEIE